VNNLSWAVFGQAKADHVVPLADWLFAVAVGDRLCMALRAGMLPGVVDNTLAGGEIEREGRAAALALKNPQTSIHGGESPQQIL
jgi:hypothetical protein